MALRRIALFADGGFLAHTTRVLEVGRALRTRYGHEVVFCCEGPYARLLTQAGFPVRPVYSVDREETLRLARRAGACDLRWWRQVAEDSVQSDLEAIDDLSPDLIVGDLRMSLTTSARARGVPLVALTNAAWTSRFAEPITVPEGHISEKLLGRKLSAALFPVVKRLLIWYWARGFDGVRKRLGLPKLDTMYDLIEGDLTLLADLPEYFPIVPSPPSFRYIGPVRFREALPRPSWLSQLDRRRPTLYFTMGSSGDARFFGEAVRVFGDSEYQVLITTAGLPSEQFAQHSNIFVEKLADGDSLMAASHVTITHGGNGTIYQALGQGVPVIGIPTMFDQEINLCRVEKLGAGQRLRLRDCKGETLKQTVESILSNSSYRHAAQKLQRRITMMDGPKNAALHINHFLTTRDPLAVPGEADASWAAPTHSLPPEPLLHPLAS
jgi:UDP:flavonoid glycosyltransferase YjiC (YdhE family)